MSTRLVGIVPTAALHVALRLMTSHRFRHLPVVGPADHRRVVSETDLLRGLMAARWPLTGRALHVDDVARPAAVVRPTDHLSAAAQAMFRCGDDVVLVEEDGVLVGLLTAADVISAAAGEIGRGGSGRSS